MGEEASERIRQSVAFRMDISSIIKKFYFLHINYRSQYRTFTEYKEFEICISLLFLLGFTLLFFSQQTSAMSENTEIMKPGEIDCSLYSVIPVWNSSTNIITTQNIAIDLDGDGIEEILFGTKNGELIAMRVPNKQVMFEYSLQTGEIYSIIPVNLDVDSNFEVVAGTISGIVCVDCDTGETQWINPNVITKKELNVLDIDGNGIQDILCYSDTHIFRLNETGKLLLSIPIKPVNNERGLLSMVLRDIDNDTIKEIVLSDYGYSWISEPGLPKLKGHHIWIFDAITGNLEILVTIPGVIFTSDPVVFFYNSIAFVAIGLQPDKSVGNYDLVIFNIPDNSSQLYEIDNKDVQIEWKYLFKIDYQVEQSNQLIICSETGNIYCMPYPSMTVYWQQIVHGILGSPIISDINSDGILDLMIPSDSIQVIELKHGAKKGEIRADDSTSKKNIEMTMGRVNGYPTAELVYGYNSTDGTLASEIVVIASPLITVDSSNNSLNGQIIYPEINQSFYFTLNNMTIHRIHVPIGLIFTNNYAGDYFQIDLIFNNSINKSFSNPLISLSDIKYEFNWPNAIISFTLRTTWKNNCSGFNNVYVNISLPSGRVQEHVFSDAFRIENHLIIDRIPSVYSLSRGMLKEQSWVQRGELLEINNFIVIFKYSNSIQPAWDSYYVLLNSGNYQRKYDLSINKTFILLIASPMDKIDFVLTLSLYVKFTNITSEEFHVISLRIDNNPPYILQSYPDNNTWNSGNPVHCVLELADNESGLNFNTVYYEVKSNGSVIKGKTWITGSTAIVTYKAMELRIELDITFIEGFNFITWIFSDNVSNYGAFNQTIKLDTNNIKFSDFLPIGWNNQHDVSCSVKILERNGSGIDRQSIQFAFSIDNIFNFSEWQNLDKDISQDNVAYLNYSGKNGRDNFIKFRGKDMASPYFVESQIYSIWIDLLPPHISIIEPRINSTVGPKNQHITFTVSDYESGIAEVNVLLSEFTSTNRINSTLNIIKDSDNLWHFYITWNESILHVRMILLCTDKVGNSLTDDSFSIRINQPPEIKINQSGINDTLYVDVQFNISVEVFDIDQDQYTIEWFIDNMSLPMTTESIILIIHTAGNHLIRVIVRDPYYSTEKELVITVREKVIPDGHRNNHDHELPLIIVILTILILILVSLYLIRLRRSELIL